MAMFALSGAILLMSMWTRDMMNNATLLKEDLAIGTWRE
jgi:hypothetical protein